MEGGAPATDSSSSWGIIRHSIKPNMRCCIISPAGPRSAAGFVSSGICVWCSSSRSGEPPQLAPLCSEEEWPYPQIMTIGMEKEREFHPKPELLFHQHRLVQWLFYFCHWPDPFVNHTFFFHHLWMRSKGTKTPPPGARSLPSPGEHPALFWERTIAKWFPLSNKYVLFKGNSTLG